MKATSSKPPKSRDDDKAKAENPRHKESFDELLKSAVLPRKPDAGKKNK